MASLDTGPTPAENPRQARPAGLNDTETGRL
jgi:hypothetical protein